MYGCFKSKHRVIWCLCIPLVQYNAYSWHSRKIKYSPDVIQRSQSLRDKWYYILISSIFFFLVVYWGRRNSSNENEHGTHTLKGWNMGPFLSNMRARNVKMLICCFAWGPLSDLMRDWERAPFQLFFPFLFSVHRIEFNDSNLLLLPSPFFCENQHPHFPFSFYSDIYFSLSIVFFSFFLFVSFFFRVNK